jgi:hypothetical protein
VSLPLSLSFSAAVVPLSLLEKAAFSKAAAFDKAQNCAAAAFFWTCLWWLWQMFNGESVSVYWRGLEHLALPFF